MKLFAKLRDSGMKLFGKVRDGGNKILGKVSDGLNKAGSIVKQFEGVGKAIVNDDTVKRLAKNNKALTQAQNVLNSGLSSNILSQASGLSNVKNYGGSSEDVTKNLLERTKGIGRSIQDSTGAKMEFV